MSKIDIPESLQFYYESPGNAQAIETLVEKIHGRNDGVTEDMSWDDLATYHRALLAGYQTQVDLWLFYKALWEEVWAPATSLLIEAGATDCKAHEYEGELSLSTTWDECMYRMHNIENGRFISSVWSDQKAIKIGFHFEEKGGGYGFSNSLTLDAAAWEHDGNEDEWTTKPVDLPVRGLDHIDVTPLQKAALAAVRAFTQALI
ncbi:hypothetical protein J7355_11340 [Endozoicomonas sp. G2_2]|uniref:YubB ferredoxin-like domain-containing protein n=1 Tax=Salinisphaera dokdonensis CL-ES53 TaxID=1304272 RepID=A0ABV2AZN8_9GAMM|nr:MULTISPECIES: hypothetical protein [Gammaproteobacteria]MAS09630.1 hypothetical protein [Salinisphaera sp.]MAS10230.1 hypothetical protein [Salinisphaera sp.]MBO9470695.1 hypothetical protein [Endozoicomonas sp. G2_2]|tara:strand:+ start:1203 stop:1811 length:609 start_codon:yes stop_codon:yes gene_type:complete